MSEVELTVSGRRADPSSLRLVATLAVDALGADRVRGVAMPSRYSSGESLEEARALAAALGIDFQVIEIEGAHAALREGIEAGNP